MANPFEILVSNLNQLGFFGFLLPWIFVFVVVYGILAKTKFFDDVKVSAITSLVVAFFVVGFGGQFLSSFFVNIFGQAAVLLAGLLVIVLFLGLAGVKIEDIGKNRLVQVTLIGIGIIIFFTAIGAVNVIATPTTVAIILMIIVMALAMAFVAGAK